MRAVLVESEPDPASRGIANALRRRAGWRASEERFEGAPVWVRPGSPEARMATTRELHIHAEGIDGRLRDAGLDPGLIVFLSKHKSESGRPTLTAHPVGNFGPADFGGRPEHLTPTDGRHLSHALRCLATARAAAGYPAEVSFEATHHGPLLSTPALFLELGSAEPQWNDPGGHEVLADAVERLLATPPPDFPVLLGMGGGHYAPRQSEAVLTKRVHFAHLLPNHHAKAAADVPALARRMKEASPGATGYYYQDGTLPQAVREAWFRAFDDLGLARQESRDWAPL